MEARMREWMSIRVFAQYLEKSSIKSVDASLVSQVPSAFPRGTRGRLHFTQHTYVYTFIVELRNGLFRNNAVVCKYSWKQCGRDLTFWDSSGSVSFFVYRRMYRSRKPRYLMQKRRCILPPADESRMMLRLVFDVCVLSRPHPRARVSLFRLIIFPRELLPRKLKTRIAKKFRLKVLTKPKHNEHHSLTFIERICKTISVMQRNNASRRVDRIWNNSRICHCRNSPRIQDATAKRAYPLHVRPCWSAQIRSAGRS